MPPANVLPSHHGCDVLHISSVHPHDDIRIIYRECAVLRQAGIAVEAAFFDVPNDARIADVPLRSLGRRPSSRLMRAWVATLAARHLVRDLHPRVVHLHDPELLFLAHRLKRNGFTVFYDAHEDLPRQIFHKPWIPAVIRPWVAQLAQRLLPSLLSSASAVIVAARHIDTGWIAGQRKVLLRNMPLASRRRTGESLAFDARERAAVYAGSLSPARELDAAVRNALGAGAEHVYLAGRGDADYLRALTDLAPDKVQCLGQLEPGPLDALLGRCRVGMALLPPAPAYLEAVPSKVFDYLKAGLPFVWSDFPHWHDVLHGELGAYAADPRSMQPQQLMRDLLDDPSAWGTARDAVRRAATHYPSAEEESAQLVELYQAALERNE